MWWRLGRMRSAVADLAAARRCHVAPTFQPRSARATRRGAECPHHPIAQHLISRRHSWRAGRPGGVTRVTHSRILGKPQQLATTVIFCVRHYSLLYMVVYTFHYVQNKGKSFIGVTIMQDTTLVDASRKCNANSPRLRPCFNRSYRSLFTPFSGQMNSRWSQWGLIPIKYSSKY